MLTERGVCRLYYRGTEQRCECHYLIGEDPQERFWVRGEGTHRGADADDCWYRHDSTFVHSRNSMCQVAWSLDEPIANVSMTLDRLIPSSAGTR